MIISQENDSALAILKYATFAILSTILAAFLAASSQLSLSPIYGSVPAALYHENLTTFVALISLMVTLTWYRRSENLNFFVLICTAFFNPYTVLIFTYLGPRYGPLVTEVVTLAPQLFSTFNAPIYWAISGPNRLLRSTTTRALQPLVFMTLFGILRFEARELLSYYSTNSMIITRRTFQIATLFASIFAIKKRMPKWQQLILFACIGLPYEAVHNKMRDQRLNERGYKILDARNSLTGYVSVIENTQNHMRALRCDHSLLGGVWLPEGQWKEIGAVVPESIYSIFVMLEAVRLMEVVNVKSKTPDCEKSALVIGLGIGTSPSAFSAHGIKTTAVEIDPIVSQFASAYFELHPNVTVINEDAITYTDRVALSTTRYDHIIHDVFTGGAEPLELFTHEFLLGLRQLLNPRGTIAINFATDIPFGATGQIISTITRTFNNCRAFRDSSPALSNTAMTELVNVAIFCSKDTSPWYFRTPVEADFLRSQTRREHLYPLHEVDLGSIKGSEGELFTRYRMETGVLSKERQESALRHWYIMRDALPAAVWNDW